MPPDGFDRFRKDHSGDERCTESCWTFVEQLWGTTTADLGGRVEIHDERSPHLSWLHRKNDQEVLGWIVYPGSGTSGDYPRLEVHFDWLRKRLPTYEVAKRKELAAREIGCLVSKADYLNLDNKKRWNLPLSQLGGLNDVQTTIRALKVLAV